MLVCAWKEQVFLWEWKRVSETVRIGHIHASNLTPFFFFWSESARASPMRWHIFRAGQIIWHVQYPETGPTWHNKNVTVCLQEVFPKARAASSDATCLNTAQQGTESSQRQLKILHGDLDICFRLGLFTGSGKLVNLVTQSLVPNLSNGNAKGVSSRAITAHLNRFLFFCFDSGNKHQRKLFQWQ